MPSFWGYPVNTIMDEVAIGVIRNLLVRAYLHAELQHAADRYSRNLTGQLNPIAHTSLELSGILATWAHSAVPFVSLYSVLASSQQTQSSGQIGLIPFVQAANFAVQR